MCRACLLVFGLLLAGCGGDKEDPAPSTDAGTGTRPAATEGTADAGGAAASAAQQTAGGGAEGTGPAAGGSVAGTTVAGGSPGPVLPAPGPVPTEAEPQPQPRLLSATAEEIEAARKSFEKLVQAQQDENPDAWLAAEQALNQSPAAAVPVLVEALEHSEPRIRERAASLLVTTAGQDDRATAALVRALEDPSAYVRVNAAAALSYLPDQADNVVEQLMELLEHEDSLLRMTATVALGNAEDRAKPAVGRLMELAASEDTAQDIRRAAVVTLGRIGPAASAALPMLEQLESNVKEDPEQAALLAAVQDAVRLITAPPQDSDDSAEDSGAAAETGAGATGPSLGAPAAESEKGN
ncbi:MAG: HEAT repeat domain-containing protein [Planctomycetaceae bacterium]|nr:HEAT repeat domain-containing protein [Planctomycetaceae bacterium]